MRLIARTVFLTCAFLVSATVQASDYSDQFGVSGLFPSVAPNGQEVAFAADFDGPSRIWIARLDGTGLRKISSVYHLASAADSSPSWSPDGRQIAYSSSDGSATDIWVMQADGTYPRRLTGGAANVEPAWSPDGRKIVFISDRDGTKDIWIMNADGTQPTKVLNSAAAENTPRFSPLGDQIVFTRGNGGSSQLMVMGVNGAGLRALTSGDFYDWTPTWSTRGIIFASNREKSDAWKLWTVQPDGSGLRKFGDLRGNDPVWLPDGRVVYSADAMSRTGARAQTAIGLYDPATGQARIVVDVQGHFTPIDIRPGKATNQINPRSSGRAQVAIVSTRTFDATKEIVQESITFGRTGAEHSLAYCSKPYKDVNNDGLLDLTCRFNTRITGFRTGDTQGVLRFVDPQGKPYEGRDSIAIVLEDDPDDFRQ